jgi:SAM-dependent methyltransferase
MDFSGERIIIGKSPISIEKEHIQRYIFASSWAKGKSCLDIACGTGYGSQMLLDAGASKVVGIDISAEAIAFARKAFSKTITFIISNAEVYNEGKYDLIVSFETIEHLENRERFLLNLYEMLENDGILMISTPNKTLVSPMRKASIPRNKWHKYEYSKRAFIRTLRTSGFYIESMYGQYLFPLIYEVEIFTKFVRVVEGWLGVFHPFKHKTPEVLPLSNKTAYFLLFILKKNTEWDKKSNCTGAK